MGVRPKLDFKNAPTSIQPGADRHHRRHGFGDAAGDHWWRTRPTADRSVSSAGMQALRSRYHQALTGSWDDAQLFVLQQALDLVDYYTAKLAECDAKLEQHYQTMESRGELDAPFPDLSPAKPDSKSKNALTFWNYTLAHSIADRISSSSSVRYIPVVAMLLCPRVLWTAAKSAPISTGAVLGYAAMCEASPHQDVVRVQVTCLVALTK
jgi:hypothetical protein